MAGQGAGLGLAVPFIIFYSLSFSFLLALSTSLCSGLFSREDKKNPEIPRLRKKFGSFSLLVFFFFLKSLLWFFFIYLYIYFVVLELQHSTHSTRTTRKVKDGVEEEEKGRRSRRAKTISIPPDSSLILCQRGGGVRWDGRRVGANITEDEEEEGKTKTPVEGEKKTRRRSINNSICSQAGWLIALHKLQPETCKKNTWFVVKKKRERGRGRKGD